MANRTKTIRVPFTTKLTSLATNTTLGTATRHDFAAVTVYMPETTRTIQFAEVQISAADEFGSAMDFDGVRMGVKINAVAFDDVDYTVTNANTGDHMNLGWRRDCTSYFVTNDPATASFTAQVGVAFATGSASNVNGITAVLVITYEYDDSASTHVKTICYPIQSHHTTISTSYVETGTTGGTSNAPANQILQLTGAGSPLLPEASITIRHYWVDVYGQSNAAGAAVTPTLRVDGSTNNARYVINQALSSNTFYFDRFDLTGLSTTAAHAFEVKSDVATTLESVGAIVWVTYEYSPGSTSTVLNSLMMPMVNGRSTVYALTDSTSTDAETWELVLNIQEPGTITMKQTGVVAFQTVNNLTRNLKASGQSARGYATASNLIRDNCTPLVHRCDHSSSTWSLSRGKNRLTFDAYCSVENNANAFTRGGYAIVNYTSDVSPNGVGAHAHTTAWAVSTMVAAGGRVAVTPSAANIPETVWEFQGSFADYWNYQSNTQSIPFQAERASGEGPGSGWSTVLVPHIGVSDGELGTKRFVIPTTDWWRRSYGTAVTDPERMNLETSRDWVLSCLTLATIWHGVSHLVTYHANTFTVDGTVMVDGAAAPDGGFVGVYSRDPSSDQPTFHDVLVLANGDGTYELEVLNDTDTYFTTYEDGTDRGLSDEGTPESDTFDITVFTTGGGGGEIQLTATGGSDGTTEFVRTATRITPR